MGGVTTYFSHIKYQGTGGHTHWFRSLWAGVCLGHAEAVADALARRVWQAMFDLLIRSAPVRTPEPRSARADPQRFARAVQSRSADRACDALAGR